MYLSLTPKARSNVLVAYNLPTTHLVLRGTQTLVEIIIYSLLVTHIPVSPKIPIIPYHPLLVAIITLYVHVYTILVKLLLALLLKGNDCFGEQECSPRAHFLSVDEKLGWFTSNTIWHLPILWVAKSIYMFGPIYLSCFLVQPHGSFTTLPFYLSFNAFYGVAMVVQVICITTLQCLDCDLEYSYKFTRAVTFGWKKDNLPVAQPEVDVPEANVVSHEIPVAPVIRDISGNPNSIALTEV